MNENSTFGLSDTVAPRDAYAAFGARETNLRNRPPCPEDPQHPGPDIWTEMRSGFLGEDGNPHRDRMRSSFRNGRYQELRFLGVSGFVICNHCDEEILLVDPWPTCFSYWTRVTAIQAVVDGHSQETWRGLDHESHAGTQRAYQARQRIANLASFLRKAVDQGYSIVGILVSHMHFDHSDDIALLLELLAASDLDPSGGDVAVQRARRQDNSIGRYRDHRGSNYLLAGSAIQGSKLPKICCDYDTMIYLLTYGFYVNYQEIPIEGDVPDSRTVEEYTGETNYFGERTTRTRVERTESRFWGGNEGWKDCLDAREAYRREANYSFDGNTEAWQTVKWKYTGFLQSDSGQRLQSLVNNDAWVEISIDNQRLHYDDYYNCWLSPANQCKAGQQAREITCGLFTVVPHVWDHSNTGCNWFGMKRRVQQANQTAGNLQRASAFMIWRSDIEGAKRTFIVGSGGEMHIDYTAAMVAEPPAIETDLLIQAILPHMAPGLLRSLSGFRRQIPRYIDFMVRNIRFRSLREAAVIFVHFEDFIRRVPDSGYFSNSFERSAEGNLCVIREKIEELRNQGQSDQADAYQTLMDENRFYVLKRLGFEFGYPFAPVEESESYFLDADEL